MAEYAYNELGLTTGAAIHDGDPYTEGLANVFADSFQELGGEIVEFTAVSVGDTDMRPVLTAVSAAGPPEILYYPVFTAECALLTNQAKEVAGLEETVLASADGCFSAAAAEAIGEAGEGMYFSGPDLAFTGDLYQQLIQSYQDNYGTEPLSVFHAHAFDATNMVFDCIEQVATEEADGTIHIGRQDMRDCLAATEGFEGITGTLTCDQYGDCADPKISVSQLQSGEYVRIWP
jgi:branched-chain amino acid transport system substrate-binding protein